MRKNILLYSLVFILMLVVLAFFNRGYQSLMTYSELTNRHNTVYNSFEDLYRQINNAAVQNPDMRKVIVTGNARYLFFSDSTQIIHTLDTLVSIVRDPVNIYVAGKLDTLVRTELNWWLNSNVPDSIMQHQAADHIVAFVRTNALIDQGIQRTRWLIEYRKQQLHDEINRVRAWMIVFISLSGLLLIYTTYSLFKQQSRRIIKEKELEVVLNRISDGVVSIDNEWRYTFLNDAALLTHPQRKEQTLGKVIWDVHPEMKGTVFWDSYHEAMLTKKVIEVESYYPPMGIHFSAKVYPSADGLTIFYKDVTESKKAEQQLSETLKELSDYKYALDESSIVAITDQKGTIQYVNDNFCQISKYAREELIGQNHRLINSGHHSSEFMRRLRKTIANGQIWKGEIRNRAKDGTTYWVDTTIVPFLDKVGKPYQYVAIRSDITERKEAEDKIIKSEKIYKTIASNIPGSAICMFDTDLRYLLIEGDLLGKLGFEKDILLGNMAASALPAEVFARVRNNFERALEGQLITTESTSNGYDVLTRFIPIKSDLNAVYAVMTVTIDVTDLKNAQRSVGELNRDLEERIARRTLQLNKSNEELEAFSYSVSHDLRAPLRGIVGFTTILQEEYGSVLDDEGKRITSIIQSNTLKMGILIDDLLRFSQLGKLEMTKTTVDMMRQVNEIIESMEIRHENIEWKIAELPVVQANITTIRQVWVNLISNAVKYSAKQQHPVIDIGHYRKDDEDVFFVKDNGVGFDQAYQAKLFKVFQRLHSSRQFEGTGVGLAIVEKIISRHGGRVWAVGEVDQGATFNFSLPATDKSYITYNKPHHPK